MSSKPSRRVRNTALPCSRRAITRPRPDSRHLPPSLPPPSRSGGPKSHLLWCAGETCAQMERCHRRRNPLDQAFSLLSLGTLRRHAGVHIGPHINNLIPYSARGGRNLNHLTLVLAQQRLP